MTPGALTRSFRSLAALALGLALLTGLAAARPDEPATPAAKAQARALNEEAVGRFKAGELNAALALFRRALDLDLEDQVLRENTGRCLLALGDGHRAARRFVEAARDYHEAGGLLPDDPQPALREGLALLEAGRERDASLVLERAAREHPDHPDVHQLLGRALYGLGENARALEAWTRALALRPDPRLADEIEQVRREEAVEGELLTDLAAPHFRIKVDGARDNDLGRRVGQALEDAYRQVGLLLGRYPPREVPVVIYPERTFRAVTGAHGWVAGLYDGKIRVPAAGLREAPPEEVRRVLTHEYAHALLSAVGGRALPTWLQEGFAQVAEGRTRAEARRSLRAANAPGLSELSGSFAGVADPRQVALLYAAACDLVHELVASGGTATLGDLVERLGRGEPLDDALERLYGRRLPELYEGWKAGLGA